jgi:hypothetical protein
MYMNDRERKIKLIEETMEIDELPENDERLLKKPEIKRDEMGRFEQHGAGLIKKKQNTKSLDNPFVKGSRGGPRAGAGRPKGAKNKIPLALKEMILNSLDRVGGEEYLAKLAIENSSAYASLLGKVLPTTLQASDSDGGADLKLTFTRVIVYPNGHKEIEGVTPKQLAPPASHTLPNLEPFAIERKEIKDYSGGQ